MRYTMGPTFDVTPPNWTPPAAPGPTQKEDVEPESYWNPEAAELSVEPKPYDPETQNTPAQAHVFLVPADHELIGTTDAGALVASSLPRTVTALSTDPAGGPLIKLPLPGYDDAQAYGGALVYAWAD